MKDYSVFCNGFYYFLYVLGLFSVVGLQGLQVSAEKVGMGNQPRPRTAKWPSLSLTFRGAFRETTRGPVGRSETANVPVKGQGRRKIKMEGQAVE